MKGIANLLERPVVVQDPHAKSLSFYCTEGVVAIDRDVVRNLVKVGRTYGQGRARICLHQAPTADFHEMLIVEHRVGYYRPHRHQQKSESCHIIEGRAVMCVFDDAGKLVQACQLGPRHHLVCRVEADRWHTVIPLTPYVVYVESKPGPFLGPADSLYPAWAPEAHHASAARYRQALQQKIHQMVGRA